MTGYLGRLATRTLRTTPNVRSALSMPFATLPSLEEEEGREWDRPVALEEATPNFDSAGHDGVRGVDSTFDIKDDLAGLPTVPAKNMGVDGLSRRSEDSSGDLQSRSVSEERFGEHLPFVAPSSSANPPNERTDTPTPRVSAFADQPTAEPLLVAKGPLEQSPRANATKTPRPTSSLEHPAERIAWVSDSTEGGLLPNSESPRRAPEFREHRSASPIESSAVHGADDPMVNRVLKPSTEEPRLLVTPRRGSTPEAHSVQVNVGIPGRRQGLDKRPSAEPTEVHVTIGRIEVTAVHAPSAPKRAPEPTKKLMSLDEYLANRQQSRT